MLTSAYPASRGYIFAVRAGVRKVGLLFEHQLEHQRENLASARRVTSALCHIKLSSFWAWNLFLFYLQRLLGDYYRVCGFLCCHTLHILCTSSALDCSYSGRCRSLYLAMDLPDQRSDKGKIVNEVVFNRKWSSDVIQGPWRWWSCVTGRN